MSKKKNILPVGTRVAINIAQGLSTGTGRILENKQEEEDVCPVYRIELEEGNNMDMHRESNGELWVNEFELKPIPKSTSK